jgi:hypothetical protein
MEMFMQIQNPVNYIMFFSIKEIEVG